MKYSLLRSALLSVILMGAAPAFAQNTSEFELVGLFGSQGDQPGQFFDPTGVTVDRFGRIVVSDTKNSRIQSCLEDGNCSVIAGSGDGAGGFNLPYGVFSDQRANGEERLLIADGGNNRIQSCTTSGVCEVLNTGDALNDPWDVVADADGNQIIADSRNHRIKVCAPDGTCSSFGQLGAPIGEFEFPGGVALYDGRIVVADRLNHRIQLCSYQGECTAFGRFGNAFGEFNRPTDVSVTLDGWIVVADTGNHRIQLCNEDGMCQDFGRFGSEPGSFNEPLAVTVDSRNRIVVADSENSRIQIFARGGDQVAMNAGMNDAWFNPEIAGQGFFVDVIRDQNTLFVMWFTFDSQAPDDSVSANLGSPDQRWYTAQGPINNERVAEMNVFLSSGGVFSQSEPKPTNTPVGTATMRFPSCKEAEFKWQLTTPENTGEVQLQRIALDNVALCEYLTSRTSPQSVDIKSFKAHTTEAVIGDWVELTWEVDQAEQCTPSRGFAGWADTWVDPAGGSAWFQAERNGTYDFTLECTNGAATEMAKTIVKVGEPLADSGFYINEGVNGAWFFPAQSGQGFHFTVWPEIRQMFISWFTFDTQRPADGTSAVIGEPGHRWLTAQGSYSGNKAELQVFNASGGLFMSAEPKPSNTPYGTVEIEFENCSKAVLKWNLSEIGNTGELNLQRMSSENVPLCDALGGLNSGSE